MGLHCHIDGHKVKLHDDLEATITANGGYEQLTASCDRKEVNQISKAHQGSVVTLETDGGREVWFGHLDATPAKSQHDLARITASGPVVRLRRKRSNYLSQYRGYDLWKPQDSEPYTYSSSGRISADSQGGRLSWNVTSGTDIKTGNEAGFAIWFSDEPITRIAFDWASLAASTDYVLQIMTSPGPAGSRTQQGADVSLNATSGTVDRNFNVDEDLVNLRMRWGSANTTTTAHYRLTVTNLRVNGRASGDEESPAEIIRDLARGAGLDPWARSSGTNALPFYWEGGSWADAVDELATLDDWPWMVYRNQLVYQPWDKDDKWDLRFSQENDDLDFPPLYNSVRVFYSSLAGAPRSILLQAKPDPLARWDIDNEYQYDLNDSYQDDDVPKRVAAALLDRVSVQRAIGTVTLAHGKFHQTGRVWTPHKRYTTGFYGEEHYRIRPGDIARLEPYPKLPPQRITGVRLHKTDVQVEFGEEPEIAATRVLARLGLMRARAHHKIRHPKRPRK